MECGGSLIALRRGKWLSFFAGVTRDGRGERRPYGEKPEQKPKVRQKQKRRQRLRKFQISDLRFQIGKGQRQKQ